LLNQLADWLDDRTGLRLRLRRSRERTVPGRAGWRYVSGPILTAVFLVQAFTGLMLMTSYSPSSSSAWGSVFYINHEMWLGWFIRGVHHYAAQAMVALLAFHLLQVIWAAAYRRPREFTWWFGVVLLILTVGFGHTGYQLPWDQKGYWSTKVVTNIVGGAPVIGPYAQKLLIGGTEYGNQTLTRFFALHVAVLPSLFVAFLVAHVALARRQGLTPPARVDANSTAATYWPHQSFRNMVAIAAVIGVIVTVVLVQGGADLDAPADPSSADYPARPEWYFLSLYQMLKYFPGNREVIGTFVIPSTLLTILFLLPLLDRVMSRRLAHQLACGFVFGVVGGAGFFTAQAFWDDHHNVAFHEARKRADAERGRALALAAMPDPGIPPDGATYILRRDPLTHGKAVLERRCLGCHVLDGKGTGEQSAPDLANYGTLAWLRGLLENPRSPKYFGKVPGCDGMTEWKKNSKLTAKQLDEVADFVASFAQIADDTTPDEWLSSPGVSKHPGLAPFQKECGTCHTIDGFTEGGIRESTGLFAWGSPRWIARMVRKPGAPDRYGFLGDQQKMPPFGPDQVSDNDVNMVVRFLRGDYPRPAADSVAVSGPGMPSTPTAPPSKAK
jgi:quinol-cytochrome oxidoreductase complex cytochrome b subunit/mono/diheme cytochrome c family protein